ncbi:hypothetical protein [Jeotgalibacillus proteolyticus]|nr:hypothetical protein [Jeotgalibacillus proteolyticus]
MRTKDLPNILKREVNGAEGGDSSLDEAGAEDPLAESKLTKGPAPRKAPA